MSVAAGSTIRLSASGRLSGGSGRFRLKPSACAARLIALWLFEPLDPGPQFLEFLQNLL
jgi:hypothetical protein